MPLKFQKPIYYLCLNCSTRNGLNLGFLTVRKPATIQERRENPLIIIHFVKGSFVWQNNSQKHNTVEREGETLETRLMVVTI